MPPSLILCACGAILQEGTVGNTETREICECPSPWKDPRDVPGYQEALMRLRDEEWSKAMACKKSSKKGDVEDDRPGRWYFITYTRPPKYYDPKDVINSTKRLLKSKAVAPIQWAYSLELQKNGTPHTHIRLFTNKYPDYKKCIMAFNDGFVGAGIKEAVQMERTNSMKYIIKAESKPDKEFLEKYKLDNFFWCSDNYEGSKPEDAVNPENIISHE